MVVLLVSLSTKVEKGTLKIPAHPSGVCACLHPDHAKEGIQVPMAQRVDPTFAYADDKPPLQNSLSFQNRTTVLDPGPLF